MWLPLLTGLLTMPQSVRAGGQAGDGSEILISHVSSHASNVPPQSPSSSIQTGPQCGGPVFQQVPILSLLCCNNGWSPLAGGAVLESAEPLGVLYELGPICARPLGGVGPVPAVTARRFMRKVSHSASGVPPAKAHIVAAAGDAVPVAVRLR